VYPIEINVRGSEECANNIDLSSQQVDQRDLGHGDPSRSISYPLPIIGIVNDRACCQEQGDDGPVCEDGQRPAQRWGTEPFAPETRKVDYLWV